jgi:hypothetical protein
MYMNMNDNCYHVDTHVFQEGLLDEGLDAVYILLLVGSDRTKKAYSQMYEYKLCQNNHVVMNAGYKNCEKKLCAQKSYYDLMDANVYAMEHANKMGYKNVMILEDDYVLDERIRDPTVIKDLVDFWNTRMFHLYSLGSVKYIQKGITTKHPKIIHSGATQCIVFSKKGRSQILTEFQKNPCLETPLNIFSDFNGHDLWFNFAVDHKYSYYKPICYQTFPETENSAEWNTSWDVISLPFLKLHKQVQPGWDILYIFMYILNILIIIVLVGIVIKMF